MAAWSGERADDTLDGLQLEAAAEHGELLEDDLFGRVEEVVAPVESGADRVMASVRSPPGTAEEIEAVVEACREVGEPERADSGRGELDRQREAVEAAGDGRQRLGVVGRERRVGFAGTSDEARPPTHRQARRHANGPFPGDSERLGSWPALRPVGTRPTPR